MATSTDAEHAYELDEVTFAYERTQVLDVPHLAIPRGKITVLVGPNGSGKTTLMHLLGFVCTPQTGRIRFLGRDARESTNVDLRRRIGLLLQQPYLLRRSVLANVEWGLRVRGLSSREARRRAAAAIRQVGLEGRQKQPATKLSGGEAKRVALAQVLAIEAEVLLLDEPLAHMDRDSAAVTESLVGSLNRERGVTVVMASHDLRGAGALAHHVLRVHDGKVTPSPSSNVFKGQVSADGTRFETGHVSIALAADAPHGTHLAIDPESIVLSPQPLVSSMRNTLPGRIAAIRTSDGNVEVEVDAGERFHVLVTKRSVDLLDLRPGGNVYLSFKSTAAQVF